MPEALLILWSAIVSWSNEIAGVLAVVTLIAQLWLVFRFRSLRKVVLRMGRAGPLAKNVEKHASEVAQFLEDFEANKSEIRQVFVRSLPSVKSIANKHSGADRTAAKQVQKSITAYLGSRSGWLPWGTNDEVSETEVGCRRVYEGMLGLVETLKDSEQDARWQVRG